MLTLPIRNAEPRDDTRIGELLIESFVSTYARKMPNVVVGEERKADLRDVAKKRALGAVILVGEVAASGGPKIVGTVTICPPGYPGSRAWTPDTWDLRYMAVDPRFHGQGLAKPLLDAARDAARGMGASAIGLHVRQGAIGVARVYTSYGYARHPEGDLDHLPEIFLEAYLLRL